MQINQNQKKIGIILSYAAQAIQMLSGLIYTPIMLRLLGQNEFGLFQLAHSVVAYLGLLSFGFASSYLRFYSRFKAKDEQNEIAKLNGMFMSIFFVISTVCILCGMLMVGNIEILFAGGLTQDEYHMARILMLIMVFNIALTFPNSVFNSFTSAHERFVFQRLLVVLQSLFNPFITLPLLLLGYGAIGMVAVTTALTLSKLIANVWYSLKILKIKFVFKGFKFSLFKEMWAFTFFIFIELIANQLNWGIGKLLLGRFIGTVAVAIYGVAAQLIIMYLQFSAVISSVFAPKVNRIVAESNDNEQLTQLFTKVGRIQFVVLSLIISGFIFMGRAFIEMWAGTEYTVSYEVALLLMIPITIPLIQNLGVEIQRAKNKHRDRSIVYLCAGICNVLVSIPLIHRFGVIGAAMGTGMSFLLGNGLFMNWYYHKRIGMDIIYFWKQIGRILPALIAPVILGILIVRFSLIVGLISFVSLGIVYVFVFCISMWFIGLNQMERELISKPMARIKQSLIKKCKKGR